jgi:hypothetical protein
MRDEMIGGGGDRRGPAGQGFALGGKFGFFLEEKHFVVSSKEGFIPAYISIAFWFRAAFPASPDHIFASWRRATITQHGARVNRA